jgi:predicted DNA-binding protein
MKSFQIRLPDELDEALVDTAKRRELTKAHVIRKAIEVYCILEHIASNEKSTPLKNRVRVIQPDGSHADLFL